jgi:hypothetical protein
MNRIPTQPEPDAREELARLLPGPRERDLPSGRHRRLQEFVMTQIDEERRAAERAARRSPKRRPVLLSAALAATAAVVATAVALGSGGGKAAPPAPVDAPRPALNGTQILLAAATTAANRPDGSGAYWHVRASEKFEATGRRFFADTYETWLDKSGTYWSAVAKRPGTSGALRHWRQGGYAFSDEDVVSLPRLRALPTEPKALKAWAASLNKIRSGDASPNDPVVKKDFAGYTATVLIDLISEAPAPPKVRSAAYRALATMGQVRFLGSAKDPRGRSGQAFSIAGSTYVVDTRTSLVLSVVTAPVKKVARTKKKTKVYDDVGWTDTRPHIPAS